MAANVSARSLEDQIIGLALTPFTGVLDTYSVLATQTLDKTRGLLRINSRQCLLDSIAVDSYS